MFTESNRKSRLYDWTKSTLFCTSCHDYIHLSGHFINHPVLFEKDGNCKEEHSAGTP